jgi:hypothetical protein
MRSIAKGSTVIIVDHTPKPGPNETGNRGVSGNQQKKAKVRSQHIIRATPGLPNVLYDVVTWTVDKINGTRAVDPFAIRREYDPARNADFIEADTCPRETRSHKADEAFNYLVEVLRSSAGTAFERKELIEMAKANTNVGGRTISDALDSLKKDPRVVVEALPAKGAPLTYRWVESPPLVEDQTQHMDIEF